jgi:hypothetical protein
VQALYFGGGFANFCEALLIAVIVGFEVILERGAK